MGLLAMADDPRVIGIKESSGSLQRAIGIATRYKDRIQLVGLGRYRVGFHVLGRGKLDLRAGELHGEGGLRSGQDISRGRSGQGTSAMATLYTAMNILESGKLLKS